MKKISIGKKPVAGARKLSADDWVSAPTQLPEAREGGVEPMKRFTIDVPRSLHTRIKSQCALQDLHMADVIREMLEERFPG
jgi:hypothetical protein